MSKVSRIVLLSSFLACLSSTCKPSTQGQEGVETSFVGPISLVTANEYWLFGASDDRHKLLRQSKTQHREWQVLANVASTITALSADDSDLYFTTTGFPSVWQLGVPGTNFVPVSFQGCDISAPSSIAATPTRLFVAAASTVWAINLDSHLCSDLKLPQDEVSAGPYRLAAENEDVLAVNTSSAKMYEIGSTGAPRTLCVAVTDPCKVLSGFPSDTIIWPQGLSPTPLAIQLRDGIVYFVEKSTYQLYAMSRSGGRPTKLPYNTEARGLQSLAATKDDLITVTSDGSLKKYPRLVLAEFRFDSTRSHTAIAKFYSYLFDEGLLPTKSVSLNRSLPLTLKDNHILLSDAPDEVDELQEVVCNLNHQICPKNRFEAVEPGTRLLIPDLYGESYIDARGITLTGSTLSHVVEKAIISPGLKQWATGEYILKLNPMASVQGLDAKTLMLQKKGTFNIPVEQVRFVVGIPVKELHDPNSHLWKTTHTMKGVRVVSLEEILSRKGFVQDSGTSATSGDASKLLSAYHALLSTIKYKRDSGVRIAYVGVADNDIDCNGPDLGSDTCESAVEEIAPDLSGISSSPPPTTSTIKDFSDQDHGTSVAALIAARHMAFGGIGLAAPDTIIVPTLSKEPVIGDSIRRAFLTGVRTFNLSIQFPDNTIPSSLNAAISKYGSALFVVAAGNTLKDEELCSANIMIYPACWGTLPNVLTVGATTSNGEAMLPRRVNNGKPIPGSNWSSSVVGVVAPGEGFYSSARGGGYVPVAGTSFATPIVSAMAALLNAQGILEPWLVKQRIVSTSDFGENFKGKSLGGLVNVGRALLAPYRTVLTDDNGHTSIVELVATNVVVKLDQSTRVVQLSSIRRLTRLSDGMYRMIIVEPDSTNLAIFDSVVSQNWPFKYFNWDPATGTTTGKIVTANLSDFTDFVGALK